MSSFFFPGIRRDPIPGDRGSVPSGKEKGPPENTGAEAGNRKPEAKETAEPAAGEAAAEEPAAGPQEVPAAEEAK